jgi:hypothetical protein
VITRARDIWHEELNEGGRAAKCHVAGDHVHAAHGRCYEHAREFVNWHRARGDVCVHADAHGRERVNGGECDWCWVRVCVHARACAGGGGSADVCVHDHPSFSDPFSAGYT